MQLPNDPGQVSPTDDIAITGMSGTFSGSHNIDEFEYKLYNQIDMVEKETRFEFTYSRQPERGGIIPENDKFDCGFFGVHGREAQFMDPLIRMLLEKCTEAIFDAGLHPEDLKNTRTGVYIATAISENQILLCKHTKPEKSFFWTGNLSNIVANRISYFFNLRGPSFVIDTACSSSLFALEHAYSAMRKGEIDSAIVGGTNLCLMAGKTIEFEKLGVLSIDGASKSFDEKANGYVRAEGICALLLQKHKDAKRIYCSVVHAKTNSDGYKDEGITFPSFEAQSKLLEEFYTECGIPPNHLSYMEAHGTGTKVGDPEECLAIDHIFTKNREKPLLIGSVKSSVGHSEAVSGCISVVKSILALEKGKISPNLHFYSPNPNIPSIVEGRLKVVTDVTNFQDDRALIGINNFGFGGANCHVLIKGNMNSKQNKGIPQDDLPRLVCLSGRTKESIKVLCEYIAEIGIDAEFIGLLHNIFRKNIVNHLYRGYIIISKDGVMDTSIRTEKYITWETPTMTAVFGVLENWYSLLENFLKTQIFSDTLERIQKILVSVKLECTILSASIEIRESYNILGSIITQICIADLMKTLKISPNFTSGYSFGEFVCAYFDGALKLEEVLECAIMVNTEFVNQIKNNENILSGINHMDGNKESTLRRSLVEKLSVVLNHPNYWRNQLISAEYFADALLKSNGNMSKDFDKSNNVVLEIGKNDINILGDDYENIQFIVFPEKFIDFLETFGGLYQLGYNIDIEKLYPAVKFPVSRGTPRISSKIKWIHHKKYVSKPMSKEHVHIKSFTIDLRKTGWSYISGHIIDGRILFPASGYLVLAWEVFADTYKVQASLPVIFENVRFIRATNLQSSTSVTFVVVISSSGYFEITEKNSIVVTGHIKEVLNERNACQNLQKPVTTDHEMTSKDIYQELRLRGYHHQGLFRAMKTCDITSREAEIEWSNNYITFIDNVFQVQSLGQDTRLLYVPTYLTKLTILPVLHLKFVKLQREGDSVTLPAYFNPHSGIIRSGGIEVQGLVAAPIPRRKELSVPVLEVNEFVPNETNLSKQLSVRVNLQIITENSPTVNSLATLEIVEPTTITDPENQLLTPAIIEAMEDIPLVQAKAKVFSSVPMSINDVVVENGDLTNEAEVYILIIGSRMMEKKKVLEDALYALQNNGYIISREPKDFTAEDFKHPDLVLQTVHRNEEETIIMMSRKYEKIPVFMKLDEDKEFAWLPDLQSILKSNSDVVLYSDHNPVSGITGFFNCLQKEPGVGSVRAVFVMDQDKSFKAGEPIVIEQLSKNLAMNIYKSGQWGTYRHLPINPKEEIESRHVYLGQLTTGDLSSLKWMGGPLDYENITEISSDDELVEVHYSSFNFKDVMLASGKITADSVFGYSRNQLCDLGLEFAGVNQNGKRVMGLTAFGGLSTRVAAKTFSTWKIPDEWSMEDAATVPVVYTTIIYGLCMRGNMKKGESILIHSGLGGVGQAAITYCLFHGLTVFTTVGSDERKERLKQLFPQLTDNRIGNSHDTSFQQLIMRETKGRGVDLVLNSLAGEKLLSSVECLAQGGRMIEIGKYDIWANNLLNLRLFEKEASFHGVMLDMFFNDNPEMIIIGKLLMEGIAKGSVKPLPTNVFKFNEVEQAFRFMAGGKHLGKVVIQIREEANVDSAKLNAQRFTGIPRFYCDPKKSYIIIGGLGGFGLELADWLVLRGARKLVLSSSRGFSNGYQRMRVKVWENYGAIIQITTVNLSTKSGCAQLIKEAQKLGPIDAVFNLAVCLKDALFENQTINMFKESFTPKAYITMHLDQLTREMCPNLRAFVVFSSVSCGKGNAGQTNYGMANSIMERICEARRRDGYAGKAIQWGAIGEVGILGEMTENKATEINIGGTLLQKISNCLQVLDTLLLNSSPIVSSIVVAGKTRGSYIAENALEAVASILGITELKSVSLHSTLSEIGMDSMTAVEIKQVLETEFDIFLSPKEMKKLTLAKLQEIQDFKSSNQTSVKIDSLDENKDKLTLFKWFVEESQSQILEIRMNSKIGEHENAPTVVAIPGIEGFMKVMEPLCENLEAHVHGLQFNYAEAPETILDMALMKLPLAEKYLSKNKPFQMIAYSYGVAEALELVGLLEAKGHIGTVYCIDGAPAVMQYFTEIVLRKTVDDPESFFILEILKAYNVPLCGLQKIALEYRKCKNLDEKVQKTIEIYGNLIPISNEYMGRLIKGAAKRLLALVAYKPTYSTLKSRIVLFKPTQPTFRHRFEHFGLEEICNEPVLVHTIEGNHNSLLSNYQLSKYINSYL